MPMTLFCYLCCKLTLWRLPSCLAHQVLWPLRVPQILWRHHITICDSQQNSVALWNLWSWTSTKVTSRGNPSAAVAVFREAVISASNWQFSRKINLRSAPGVWTFWWFGGTKHSSWSLLQLFCVTCPWFCQGYDLSSEPLVAFTSNQFDYARSRESTD